MKPSRSHLLLLALLALSLAACGGGDSECSGDSLVPVLPARDAPVGKPASTFVVALAPLSSIALSPPTGGDIVDSGAAIRLGKALFWDIQAGSDGQTACASCHFHAGADNRRTNAVNPGQNNLFDDVTGPDQVWDGRSLQSDDAVGSAGVVRSIFVGLNPDPSDPSDVCRPDPTSVFGTFRQVTPRNSPSAIGAIFNRINFWDGRAESDFNGLDPFGAYSLRFEGTGCAKRQVTIDWVMKNASLASQAMGPPANDAEMICTGRPIDGPSGLGKKLLERQPLALQQIAPDDSVLGALAAPASAPDGTIGRGLLCGGTSCTYRQLVNDAFGPTVAADAETHFGRIWGQALLAYEATLVPDQTPLDQYLEGNTAALDTSELLGLDVFQNKGNCIQCHSGPTLSDASNWFAQQNGLINADGGDQGFHNIGVRPTGEDLGRATVGPNGLSYSVTGDLHDRGAFKTPALRDVALTPPYFHNGSKGTLLDVLAFYVQGGDFPNPELASQLKKLNLTTAEHDGLLDLLQNGLTDCRVKNSQAPFDHPSLPVPNGPLLPPVGASGTAPCP